MTAVETASHPARTPPVWPMSVEAYHALGEMGFIPEKTELLYGQVFEKMPESPLHRLLFMRLLQLLLPALTHRFHLQPEKPLRCPDSEPVPDLSVIAGSIEDYRTEHPRSAELVIEVCVSSYEHDFAKLRAYAAAGVKECWLVLGPERQVEVFRQPRDGQFAERVLHGPGGSVTSAAVPAFTVELDRLFAP